MSAFSAVLKRELRAYFASPLAYVFLGVYLLMSGLATWNLGRFFETARVELTPFFQFQPWFLAVLAPAIGMRLWSEDLRSLTVDVYLTSPVSLTRIHLAKFLAALCVLSLALISSLPYWVAVSWLGSPDHGVIALSYLHLFLLSGLFLAVTMAFSAATQQQVTALVLSVLVCLLLLVLDLNLVTDGLSAFLSSALTESLRNFGVSGIQLNAWRGVLKFSDILTSVGLTTLFMVVGISALHTRRMAGSPRKDALWLLGSIAVLFLAFPSARALADRTLAPLRLDVTGYQLNTLSAGARDLARSLEEPVELTLYYSTEIGAEYPNIRAHAERVTSLLSAFERASHGKILLRTVDPIPFSAGEDDAIVSGVRAVPTEGLDPLYFGLSGRNLVDDQETIGFLAPEQDDRLEFEIASLISRLDRIAVPRIGILSGVPALSGSSITGELSAIQKAIEDQYAIDWIAPDAVSLPADMSALIIAQPPELAPHLHYLIERYLAAGGRAIILTDPQPLLYDREVFASQLNMMASAWKLNLSTDIIADPQLALPVAVQTSQGVQTQRQPVFIGPGPAQMNRSDFLTAGLQKPIHFGAAGWMTINSSSDLQTTPLIVTGNDATSVSTSAFRQSEQTPAIVRQLMSEPRSGSSIAFRISGRLPQIFDAAPEVRLPDDPVLRRLTERQWNEAILEQRPRAPAEIVWIHDTDFLFDPFYLNPQNGSALADNQTFVLSMLDQFAGNPELARLRARPQSIRAMTRVVDLRRAAEAEYLDELTETEDELAAIEDQLEDATPEEQPDLRSKYLDARKSLRSLQSRFRSRIENLETWLRWLTIWIPAGLAFLMSGLIRPLMRRRA